MKKEYKSKSFVSASSMVDFMNNASIDKENIISIYGNKDMHVLVYIEKKEA